MHHVTIAFSTMADYWYCTCMTMISAILSAKEDTFYDFAVLGGKDFKQEHREMMLAVMSAYPRHEIRFYDVSRYDFVATDSSFVLEAAYYRLLLPKILNVGICLYLDGDVIVCDDLRELSRTDIEGFYLAGVKAPAYHDAEERSIAEKAAVAGLPRKLPDHRNYINSGVLLMNLAKMREDGKAEEFMELMQWKFSSWDQDVLNAACYDAIYPLPFKYNVMTKYADWSFEDYHGCFTMEEVAEGWSNPSLIHYADKVKPWSYPSMPFGDRWWEVARRVPELWPYFCRRVFNDLARYSRQEARQPRILACAYMEKIALWGTGKLAKRALAALREEHLSPAFFVVSDGCAADNCAEVDGIPVYPLGEARKHSCGVTLLMTVNPAVQRAVRANLVDAGFFRIVWDTVALWRRRDGDGES